VCGTDVTFHLCSVVQPHVDRETGVAGVPVSSCALVPMRHPQVPVSTMRAHLSRTASLNRIRQFPAYLCNHSFLSHALCYLQTSSTAVQAGLTLVRGYLLYVAVYLSLFLLTAQLSACCCALFIGATPPGLIFMLASLFAMCGMACKIVAHDSSRRAQ
jgi:hypothetical protein